MRRSIRGDINVDTVAGFNEAIEEMVDAYISESISHFLKKVNSVEDDSRYLYTTGEVSKFVKKYTDAGGDINGLHISKIFTGEGFLGWEVTRKYLFFDDLKKLKRNYYGEVKSYLPVVGQ